MENYRFDPYTGRPLSPPSMPPRTWGAYPPRGLPQASEPPLSQSPAEQSKVNANNMDFYVYMAKAFLEDKDARNQGGEKLARYHEYVVM